MKNKGPDQTGQMCRLVGAFVFLQTTLDRFSHVVAHLFSYEVDIFVAAAIMTDFSIPLLYSRYSKTCLKRPLKIDKTMG